MQKYRCTAYGFLKSRSRFRLKFNPQHPKKTRNKKGKRISIGPYILSRTTNEGIWICCKTTKKSRTDWSERKTERTIISTHKGTDIEVWRVAVDGDRFRCGHVADLDGACSWSGGHTTHPWGAVHVHPLQRLFPLKHLLLCTTGPSMAKRGMLFDEVTWTGHSSL